LAFEPFILPLQTGYLCRLRISFATSFPGLQLLQLIGLKLLTPAGQMRGVKTFPAEQSAYFARLAATVSFGQNALFVGRTEPSVLNRWHHFRVWYTGLELTIMRRLIILLVLRHHWSSCALIIFDSIFLSTVVSLMLAQRAANLLELCYQIFNAWNKIQKFADKEKAFAILRSKPQKLSDTILARHHATHFVPEQFESHRIAQQYSILRRPYQIRDGKLEKELAKHTMPRVAALIRDAIEEGFVYLGKFRQATVE
jgi:hypothetical protein